MCTKQSSSILETLISLTHYHFKNFINSITNTVEVNILIVHKNGKIPVKHYGGTQRDIWIQGKELVNMGHSVTFLVKKGSSCPFAQVIPYNKNKPFAEQIPSDIDFVHFHSPVINPEINKPYMVTVHGNGKPGEQFDQNTVFVSKNHAERHNSDQYVYNGLDLDDLGPVNLNYPRKHLVFLAKASRSVKNLSGCIEIAGRAGKKLAVIGGRKLNVNPNIKYYGYIGGAKKSAVLQAGDALLFPVLWHEPLGLAILESLYFGCPVFGTPYGSLPELITPEFGFLSNSKKELVDAVQHLRQYDRKKCHELICDQFSGRKMTEDYLKLFEKVMNGEKLNKQQPRTLISSQKDELFMDE